MARPSVPSIGVPERGSTDRGSDAPSGIVHRSLDPGPEPDIPPRMIPKRSTPMHAGQHFESAKSRFQAGDPTAAHRLARAGLIAEPGSPVGLTLLGMVAAKLEEAPRARRYYRYAVPAAGGRHGTTYRNLARIEEKLGNMAAAERTYLAGIAVTADRDALIDRLARHYAGRGLWMAAARALNGLKGNPLTPDQAELCGIVGMRLAGEVTKGEKEARGPAIVMLQRALSVPTPVHQSVSERLAEIYPTDRIDSPDVYDIYRRALVQSPVHVHAMRGVSAVLKHRGKKVRSASWLCQATVMLPDNVDLMSWAATAAIDVKWPWRSLGRLLPLNARFPRDRSILEKIREMFELVEDDDERDRAAAWAHEMIAINPDDPSRVDIGLRLLHGVEREEGTDPIWDKVQKQFPLIPVLHYNRALFMQQNNEHADSLDHARRAVLVAPEYHKAYNLIGMATAVAERRDLGIRYCRMGATVSPASGSYWLNIGTFHRAQGNLRGAIDSFQAAGRDETKKHESQFNLAITNLMIGELHRGFGLYESRWGVKDFPSPRRSFRHPIWQGPQQQPQRTIVVYMEQGMGDEIMFSYYLPYLIKDCHKVVLDCDERLVDLFQRSFPEVEAVPRSKQGDPRTREPDVRNKVPIGHVAQYYVVEVKEDIRNNYRDYLQRGLRRPPRLTVDPDKLEYWRAHLKARFGDRKVIAVSWRSSLHNRLRDQQYVAIEDLASSLGDGVGVVNLQYSFIEEEHDGLVDLGRRNGFDFHTPRQIDLKDDLDDIMAILQLCDAVVTPLISLAWMAGAVGTPTWVYRAAPELRTWHMFGTPFVPYAPSIKLFFRDPKDSWEKVSGAIRRHVAHLARTGEVDDLGDPE